MDRPDLIYSDNINDVIELNTIIHDEKEEIEELLARDFFHGNLDNWTIVSDKVQQLKNVVYEDYMNGKYSDPLKVYGPKSWFRLSLNNKIVNVFGEEHSQANIPEGKTNSYDFAEFLRRVCDSLYAQGTSVDIFLESRFVVNDLPPPQDRNSILLEKGSPLMRTNILFQDCLRKNKKHCRYGDMIRFHYIDIRGTRKYLAQGFSETQTLCSNLSQGLDAFVRNKFQHGEEALDALEELNDVDSYLDLYLRPDSDYPFVSKKLRKQLDAVPKYRKQILDYFGVKCENEFTIIKKYIKSDFWEELVSETINFGIKEMLYIKFLSKLLDKVDSILTDIYVIARFFRTYDWSPEAPILFYTGLNHAQRYEGFFFEMFDLAPREAYTNQESNYITGEHFQELWQKYM